MTTVELRRVTESPPRAEDVNQLVDVALGVRGAMLRLRGYNGTRKTIGGIAPPNASGNYNLDVQSANGKHLAVVHSSTSATALPTAANSVLLIEDGFIGFGRGTAIRIYETAGTDYSELTSADGLLAIKGSGANAGMVALGATPATTGSLRLSKASSIKGLNNGGTADIAIAATDASDVVTLGDAANSGTVRTQALTNVVSRVNATDVLTLTATLLSTPLTIAQGATPAAAGTGIRMTNNTGIYQRNGANSADLTLISADGSNTVLVGVGCGVIHVGDNSTGTTARLQTASGGSVRLRVASTDCLIIDGTTATCTLPIASGTNPASAGQVRIPNNTLLSARNAANSANIDVIGTNASDQVQVGASGTRTNLLGTVFAAAIDPPTIEGQVTSYSQCKAFAFVTGGGGATLGDNYNIASVTRNAAGDFTIAWDRDFAATSYGVLVTLFDNGVNLIPRVNGKAVGSADVHFYTTAGVLTDPDGFTVSAWGTLS